VFGAVGSKPDWNGTGKDVSACRGISHLGFWKWLITGVKLRLCYCPANHQNWQTLLAYKFGSRRDTQNWVIHCVKHLFHLSFLSPCSLYTSGDALSWPLSERKLYRNRGTCFFSQCHFSLADAAKNCWSLKIRVHYNRDPSIAASVEH
jgi:hypothetical protein